MPQNRKIPFSQETVDLVLKFYKDEEVSRIMPGKKDYKSIKRLGQKVHEQKYLFLCNLKEIYKLFKSKKLKNKKFFKICRTKTQRMCTSRRSRNT